jgi:hypothetical protein
MPNAQLRANLRNFLYPMNESEVRRERELSLERGDEVRADCIDDYLNEEFETWADWRAEAGF